MGCGLMHLEKRNLMKELKEGYIVNAKRDIKMNKEWEKISLDIIESR